MKKLATPIVPMVCSVLLSACASHTLAPSPTHIAEAPRPAGAIPEPVQQSAALPPPGATAKVETYSVTVHKVPVESLLFALARDAGLNVDIHPGIEGVVTLNALDQTLPQLLSRIQRQVDMRYEIHGDTLTVLPDTPEWRNYKVDYVNIARSTSSSVNIATQISTTGGGSGASNPVGATSAASTSSSSGSGQSSSAISNNNNGANGNGSNNSTTVVNNRSDNNFWYSLEKNIRDMLRNSNLADSNPDPLAALNQAGANTPGAQPATAPAASSFDAAAFGGNKASNKNSTSVIVNAEGGLIAVRATARQHEKIREFLDIVLGAAKRQVLIEATIIEVRLGDQYQQGINWSSLSKSGLKLTQGQVGTAALPSNINPGTSPGVFVLNYTNPTSRLGNIASTIQLLESFGKVKVLSSPKISVLNNQTALLKVVDNNVFFSIKVTPAVLGVNGTPTSPATYESKLETVPVGFVMSVTPQISESDEVTLNVRPTITRIVGYVQDPNPALGTVVSKVPVIQARELESLMKVSSGQIAVMGGLMQDSVDNAKDGIPGLSSVPVLGNLFSYRNENASKTELVIFMRPVVVKDASVNGDYKDYRYMLPGSTPDTAAYGEAAAPAVTVKGN
ncbi:pilus (MSHA type) biogenesis protein MshL [Pseudoduganella sp. FT93W]|uniref:Pilus (MSHA type) biogenesis protein MshL n=1 Tax=Duganella fentianensis TaxID=2692177 RepID=A0A845I5N8_9BURK|nr:pilus (MSHA type) biogenesis protein MshL [Duganella fentianensis]MYN47485.1 pilus (MSHA type) biogenesis protein MshL [Duganella fentianensis]